MKILGYKLMRTSEELIETLEENQVVIQNMMTSKYIAFFLTEMSAWQKTLGMVDVVIARSDCLNSFHQSHCLQVVRGSTYLGLSGVNLYGVGRHSDPAS